jgi:hypothetical protein
MRSLRVLLASVLAASALAACAADPSEEEGAGEVGLTEAAVTSLDPAGAQPVAIVDPAALRELETRGFGFGHHFAIAGDVRADALVATPAWSSIANGITANLDALKAADGLLGVGMQHDHRLFDQAWLRSSRSRFALVAVTNRLDRASGPGDCGEVRFIHRLEYDDPREGTTSRMPMTVAVVVPQKPRSGEQGCTGVVARWQSLSGKTGAPLAASAASGPLLSLPAATSFETNLQAVRWPSSVRKDMGGEAEYMLNVWRPAPGAAYAAHGSYQAAALENTPDVEAIRRDPAKRQALVTWMKSHVWAIDRGTAKLPPELAAHTAYSYGPRGLARLANRPWSAIVTAAELDGAPFAGTQLVKGAAGMLRRLDEQSCQGCHQARGIAGFHVLGNDDEGGRNAKLNRLTVGTSPHFNEELAWRTRLLRAVASGADASSPPESRPFAERATSDGLVGQSCALVADATFGGWVCHAGLACKDMIGDGVVGTCQPAAGPGAGDACEKDRLTASIDPHADEVQNLDPGDAACRRWRPEAACSGASGGFPGGACAAACPKLGLVKGDGICGSAPPAGFNECMAGHERSFEECMSPPKLSYRKACSVSAPCRDDYACAFVPGAPAGIGACMPPYFIFQARVDGHE